MFPRLPVALARYLYRWLPGRRARADARVAGVESVDVSGIVVDWLSAQKLRGQEAEDVQVSDTQIAEAVRDAFALNPRVAPYSPDVVVRNSVVSLVGTVGDAAARQAATEAARNVTGVRRVRNFLKVRPVEEPADHVIKDRIVESLNSNPYVDRPQVNVTVNDGEVYLTGGVDNGFEKDQAGAIARRVASVTKVYNRIDSPTAWTWEDDWELQSEIESQIFWSPYLDQDDIDVVVDDGAVTLSGTVDSWFDRREATQAAWRAGAGSVNNQLEVE